MTNNAQRKPGFAGAVRWAVMFVVISVELMGFIWLYPLMQSHAVMSVYSASHYHESVMKQNGLKVMIPSGEGWYPLMLVYNADGFDRWSGIDARMTVLYSFGAFDMLTRTSALYDAESDRYSAFYGAYVVDKNGGAFGFYPDGTLNADEVKTAVRYDYTQLVMANFGCESPVFDVIDMRTAADTQCAGSGGWTLIEASIRVNGAAHRFAEHKTAYLQYGRPTQTPDTDFAETVLHGRVYAKYLPEYECTVMLYCIAPDWSVVDECDANLLRPTTITGL